jgi:hypothetical protein
MAVLLTFSVRSGAGSSVGKEIASKRIAVNALFLSGIG